MLNYYNFNINNGDRLNRWMYSGPYIIPFDSDPAVFYEPVNLTEEYRQVEYPLRSQYLQQRMENEYPEMEVFENIYFPFESSRFDFSSFITTPHVLKTYAKTFIKTNDEQTLSFRVITCGSVDIWVNKQRQVTFSPFTRNIPSTENINLSLQAGENEIVVLLEDLAERDINYYFELIYQDHRELENYLLVNEDPIKIKMAEEYLDQLHFEKDIYKNEELTLISPSSLDGSLDPNMVVEINKNKLVNPVFTTNQSSPEFDIKLNDNKVITMGKSQDYNLSGLNEFTFGIRVSDNLYVYRTLTVSLFMDRDMVMEPYWKLETRKRESLKYFANLEQNDLNVGIAKLMYSNYLDNRTEQALRSCFQEIEQKEDCADFRLAPLLAVFQMKNSFFPKQLQDDIKRLSLNFRYWIDEPGDDVMWYFSENHAFLFHVSQYLAGHLFAEEVFQVSKRMGWEQYVLGRTRLLHWFDNFFEYGFAEWNSTTYLPIDLIGFYSLYESAPDKDIQELAKKALDKTFKVIAINMHGKTMASTYGRVYEHDLKAMENSEISNISYILWGEGYFNHSLRAPVWFCLSQYTPPEYQEIVRMEDNQAMLAEYTQGIKQIYSYVYKTKEYSLAGAMNISPYEKGHQQHVMNVSLGNENTTMWINNPGETAFSGKNRPSFWAGNGRCPVIRQHKNIMLMKYKFQYDDYKITHVYLPVWDMDEVNIFDNWLFVRKGNAYVGIYSETGFVPVKEKATVYREVRSYGSEQYYVIKCSSYKEAGAFKDFMEKLKRGRIKHSSSEFFVKDFQHGDLKLSEEDELYINGLLKKYSSSQDVEYQKLNVDGEGDEKVD
ncbi:hypothetical protein [Salibacterium lacus]|uniref:Uncharacterized protein n=1 Tax=Salibacterium lacus TaxID=1898109 RepID=A0ABW5T2P1_9BACI